MHKKSPRKRKAMNLFSLPQGTGERAGAVGAGSVAIVASFLGPHGLELLLWVLVAMGVDLAAGLVKALIQERLSGKIFVVGVLKKILMIMVVYPAAMADRIINLSGVVNSESGPIVFAVLVALCMYEGASITRNIKDVYGEAGFVMVVLRAWDSTRWAAYHDGQEQPHDRSYDRHGKRDEGDDA